MQIDQNSSRASSPARAWRAMLDGYRFLNRATHHVLGAVLMALLVAYFVFCGLFLGLRYLVLPNIDRYKPQVEQMASRAVGRPVTIATIHASWHGLNPRLALTNVAIHNRMGTPALSLPRVSGTVSWWSAVAGGLRFQSLEIERPDLEIERDRDGRFHVGGILLDPHPKEDDAGLDWLLSQRQIVIRDGWVRWKDGLRDAPELVLNRVDVALLNKWRRHRFALKAVPPAEFGAPLDVRAYFQHPAFGGSMSDPMQWTGTLYADWRNTDLALWKTYFDYPLEVGRGKGAVRAWLDFDHGRVADLTADLTLSDLAVRLRPDLPALELARVDGRIAAGEAQSIPGPGRRWFGSTGHRLELTDFSLQTGDGKTLPPTTISHVFWPATTGQRERNEVRASVLDLQPLAELAANLPLPEEQRRLLAELAPRGQLRDVAARWQGAWPHIVSYRLRGQFAGLSWKGVPARSAPAHGTAGLAPRAALPGIRNASGSIDASEPGGALQLDSSDMALQLPRLLADPLLPFERLNLRARWERQGQGQMPGQAQDQLQIHLDRLDFVHDGMAGSASGKHRMVLGEAGGGGLGRLDLAARLDEFDLKKIGRYLPLDMDAEVRDWLGGALAGGTARDVALAIQGDLARFPFHGRGQQEKFTVSARIVDGTLNYAPGFFGKDGKAPEWPLLEAIRGQLEIDGARLSVRADSAATHGVALTKVSAEIPNLVKQGATLDVAGNAAGRLQDFLDYTTSSPVAGWIEDFTEGTRGSGNARLALKLHLPLADPEQAKVQGTLQFMGNEVALMPELPPLSQASGELKFHEKGFSLPGIRAIFLGGPVFVFGRGPAGGAIAVRAEGALTAEGLGRAYPGSAMQRLLEYMRGGARYATLVKVRDGRLDIAVDSPLEGMALDFPAPLAKAAGETLPLKFTLAGLPSDDPAVLRDEIRLSLGSAIAAHYERRKGAGAPAAWQVVRGGIGINVPPPQPDSGVIASVNLKSLDIDAWRNSVSALLPSGESQASGPGGKAPDIAQYIEPEVLAARASELIVMGKKLDNVVVGASHRDDTWQANIDSTQASGYVTWNEPRSGRGLGRVTARLASLTIPQSSASDVSELLDGKGTDTQIPALDIVAERFELLGKSLGRLELLAHNASGPAGREWRIRKLALVNPDGSLHAEGEWANKGGERQSRLKYGLEIADAGSLLERLGFAGVLRGGNGKMEGEVNWKGLPYSLDIPTLSGQVRLELEDGQFLKVEPGAAKLLGVLSLQALPRRLTLDFRDLFSEGFAFDGVAASASIAQGVMTTDSFKMRSVNAAVLLDGAVDIARESQDLHVVVIPEINFGAASVAYGLIVNPVVGLGSFLAQLFLRDPLMQAFTMEYRVSGPWKDPLVKKLPRRHGGAAQAVPEAGG